VPYFPQQNIGASQSVFASPVSNAGIADTTRKRRKTRRASWMISSRTRRALAGRSPVDNWIQNDIYRSWKELHGNKGCACVCVLYIYIYIYIMYTLCIQMHTINRKSWIHGASSTWVHPHRPSVGFMKDVGHTVDSQGYQGNPGDSFCQTHGHLYSIWYYHILLYIEIDG